MFVWSKVATLKPPLNVYYDALNTANADFSVIITVEKDRKCISLLVKFRMDFLPGKRNKKTPVPK